MATGHVLPGYGEPVTRLHRVLSAGVHPSLDSSTIAGFKNATKISQTEFDEIRQYAKATWTNVLPKATTYNTYFSGGEIKEITTLRPTSSHRRNNPHPPEIFLTNRMHKIDEYRSPGPSDIKAKYDNTYSSTSQKQRELNKMKYINHLDSSILKSYKDPYGFKKPLSPYEAQAAESWIKLAVEEDHDRVLDVVKSQVEVKQNHMRPNSAFPSLYRWMKISGAKEMEDTSTVLQNHKSDPTQGYEICEYTPKVLGQLKREEISATSNPCCQVRLSRGEYSIHPGWPPTLRHHRIP
ncbi:hypothetical protein Btru_066431 [Bulinus truncatus]|nr:hypothetical protein Btru_066431 [Bulinus truncatus]